MFVVVHTAMPARILYSLSLPKDYAELKTLFYSYVNLPVAEN